MAERPNRWWYFCEGCLKPFVGVGIVCDRCDFALLELCPACFAGHRERDHGTTPTEFDASPATEPSGKPPGGDPA